MDETQHPARALPDDQRVNYLLAVAAVAYADRKIAETEREKLRDLCGALGLSAKDADRVVSTVVAPHPAQLARSFAAFRQSDVRYALLVDATVLAFADGQVASGEAAEIARFADALGIDTAQACLIGRYVEEVIRGNTSEGLSDELSRSLSEASASLPARGVIQKLFAKLRAR